LVIPKEVGHLGVDGFNSPFWKFKDRHEVDRYTC
jgi:hypothetical protein